MSTHILRLNEFQTALNIENSDTQPLYEGLFNKLKMKNQLSRMLAPTMATGKDIFKTINENVERIEKIISDFNKKAKSGKKDINARIDEVLMVEFDTALLNIQSLLDLTDVKTGTFTRDVLMCNIINYKIFVSPIRMAQIMSLGYRYYMTIIKQALQNALITIELYSDTFFTMVRDNVMGNAAKFNEMFAQARDLAMQQLEYAIAYGKDEYGNNVQAADKLDKKTKEKTLDIIKQFRGIATEVSKMNRDIGYGGYRTNIFQEGGHNIEQLTRDNTGKELQAMQERFTQLGNKPSKDGDDNMVALYAAAVKSNAEARAYSVCSKISMNMMKIVKMFSLRSQEGLSALVSQMSEQEQLSISNEANELKDIETKVRNAKPKQYKEEPIVKTKEEKDKEKQALDKMGFNLLDKTAYNKLLNENGSMSYAKFLVEQKFTEKQASEILDGKTTVGSYKKAKDLLSKDFWLPKEWEGPQAKRTNAKTKQLLPKDVLKEYGLVKNPQTGRYDCKGNIKVDRSLVKDGKFKICFGIIDGEFDCSNIGLISLEGAPTKVKGDFVCKDNNTLTCDEKHFYKWLPEEVKNIEANGAIDVELAKHYMKYVA